MKTIILILAIGQVYSAGHHGHHATHAPTTTIDPNSDEGRLQFLENGFESLARQIMMQQLFVEERIRSDGDSGIKQLRMNHQGTRTFFSPTHSLNSVNSIHNHANYKLTAGMGEVIAVMNGVEFRTRHNDYKLRMPSTTSQAYHAMAEVPFPDVPPSVKSQPTLQKQIEEMRNYFKAWKYQNPSFRDYRPYFKAVLCYMEGAWTTNTKSLSEPFSSDRHFIDASSWFDLQEKVRFTSYTGGKHNLENFSFLPTTIMNMRNGTPEYAQWNYRILCHPIKDDLPLKVFEPVDDLASRLAHKFTVDKFTKTRAARFHLPGYMRQAMYHPDHNYGQFKDTTYNKGLIDIIMNQIPGKNNYPAKLYDNTLGMEMLDPSIATPPTKLNTGFYHRRYKYEDKGAMGLKTNYRGYADQNMWVAQTSHPEVAAMEATSCQSVNHTKICKRYQSRYTYAIPLEIIYLTPLHTWNPYNLPCSSARHSEYHVIKGGRNGGFNSTKAYNGTSTRKYYYLTPSVFFSGNEMNHDKADTVKNAVGVLDSHGVIRSVSASGTRIFLPNIPGVGALRQRWPITPVHRDGSSIFKEVDALKEMVNHMGAHSNLFQEQPTLTGKVSTLKEDAHFRTSFATRDPPGRHQHDVYIDDSDYQSALGGKTVIAQTSMDNSHKHELEITYNSHTKTWMISKCDGQAHCWDGHSNVITKVVA